MDKISLNLVEADRHFGKTTKPGNNPDRVSTRERREEGEGGVKRQLVKRTNEHNVAGHQSL